MFSHFCPTRGMLLCAAALLALNALAYRELSLQPDGRLHVHFLDVGQGDATLVVSPSGKRVLVDGGPNMATLEHLGRFMPFFDRNIHLVVLTHPNADHIAALPEILRRYRVHRVLLAGSDYPLGHYEALISEVLQQEIPVTLADPSQDIDLGDATTLDIVWPAKDALAMDVNNASVVLRVLRGNHAVLLPGDIEEEAERAILRSGAPLHAGVLKAPHHGSKTSSSTGFLLAVAPEIAIVSAGEGNSFGHPHEAVLDRYRNMGIALRSTAKEGTISLTFP